MNLALSLIYSYSFYCTTTVNSGYTLHFVYMPVAWFTCPPFCLCARHVIFPWFCPSSLHKRCARDFILPVIFSIPTSLFACPAFSLRARNFHLPVIFSIPTSLFTCPPFCLRARHFVNPHQFVYIPSILFTCPPFRSARHFVDPH